MFSPTTISPLEAFQKEFGYLDWDSSETELKFPFTIERCAAGALNEAQRVILTKGLTLTAAVETYPYGDKTRICVVIRPVPEEYTFEDEAPDTEHYQEERAECVKD